MNAASALASAETRQIGGFHWRKIEKYKKSML